MKKADRIQNEVIQRFGDAYRSFGLNKLMGHIIALLIYSPEPLSLDDIAGKLGRSKGPVSQIVRRLKDRHLIRKVWQPENNRKDFYEIEPDVFENAFKNNLDLIRKNKKIAENLIDFSKDSDNNLTFSKRLNEMQDFYRLMEKHFQNFIDDWEKQKSKYK